MSVCNHGEPRGCGQCIAEYALQCMQNSEKRKKAKKKKLVEKNKCVKLD